LKNRAQLSRASRSPVSVVIPREIISRTVGTSTFSVASSMQLGACTVITRPGYAPGMPGVGHGLKRVTTRYFGICRTSSAESAGTSAAAARNLRRSTGESMRRIIVAREKVRSEGDGT
jgi:hypothetical protein